MAQTSGGRAGGLSRRQCVGGMVSGAVVAGAAMTGLGSTNPASASPASATTSGAAAAESRGSVWAGRADETWRALQRYFRAGDGSGLYREQYPVASADQPYSYEWPFSQAHVAALDLTGMAKVGSHYRDDLSRLTRAQQHYWDSAGTTGLPGFASYPTGRYGAGGDFFYDDNEWVGLLDVQHRLRFHDRASVREAEKIFRLVVSGWDDDPSHGDPGGVFWTQATWSTDRNTVSNMPGALLGLGLYKITGEKHYLDWSLRMYEWTNRYLQRDNGLYNDHLSLTGVVEDTVWSYNQGVPVGVNTLLAEITGERRYLREAGRIARAAASYYGTAGLDAQPVFFNSIYFKNLLLWESRTGGDHVLRSLRSYATRLWRDKRDPKTGLFHFSDDGATQMIEQAAATQVFAVLAWPRRDYRLLG